MAVVLLSFDVVSHHAGLGFVEPNLVYEHQNVDQGTESYPEGVLSTLGCRCYGYMDSRVQQLKTDYCCRAEQTSLLARPPVSLTCQMEALITAKTACFCSMIPSSFLSSGPVCVGN